MSETTEVIGEYHDPGEAQAARERLQEEGITVVVTGEFPDTESEPVFGMMHQSPIQLAVPASLAEKARNILAGTTAELEAGWESMAEKAIEGWICHGCDTPVPQDQDTCPECGALRSEQVEEGED